MILVSPLLQNKTKQKRLGVGWSGVVRDWSGVGPALVGHSWGIHQNCFSVLHFILFSGEYVSDHWKKNEKKSIHKGNAPAMQ